jgi:hypothetical protein
MALTASQLQSMRALPASVPCGSCRACCRNDAIQLGPKDDLDAFRWHIERGLPTLDRKPSGECIYLTERGCSVHAAPPDICRRFDCRVLFLTTPKAERRIRVQVNPSMVDVYAAGKKRAHTLEERNA